MSGYEVLPDLVGDDGEVLSASYTANNGIRLQIRQDDGDWAVFDFTSDQANLIGGFLLWWAGLQRAVEFRAEQRKEAGQ